MSEPEQKWPVTLDESRPETCIIPPDHIQVEFENIEKRPLATAALRETLKHQETRFTIKRVVIGYTSLMQDTSILELFPNVELVRLKGKKLFELESLAGLPRLVHLSVGALSPKRSLSVLPRLRLVGLGVEIRKAVDLEHVRACGSVQDLGLEWPWPGWRELDGLRLKSLNFGRGKLERATDASIEVRHLYFNSCRRLKAIGGVRASELMLIACPNLDLSSLGEIKGLRDVSISYGGKVSSMEFVRGCQSLVHLVMTATRVMPEDVSPMIESKSLRAVWLQTPSQVVAAIGTANPRITICNGSVCYHEGRKAQEQDYHRRCVEVARE